jgi:predicted RNA-binding protein with PUA-like domain
MQYWLVKQEPEDYSWDDLEKDGRTAWTGVRNFQARINLRAMKKGDLAFFYHSGQEKQVVGVATILREAYPDPTATEGDWPAVDIGPVKALKKPVTLAEVKAQKPLQEMKLVRQSRLSVSPVTSSQFEHILRLAGTSL